MPFKMMSPLSKVATSAMKAVQKSAVKKLSPDQKKLDKNKSGDLDSQDFKMLRSSNKMQPSGLKAMGGSTMRSEKSTPLFVNSPAKVQGFGAVGAAIKDALDKNQGKGKYLSKAGLSKYEINLLKRGITSGASKGLKESYNKAKAKQDAYNKKMAAAEASVGRESDSREQSSVEDGGGSGRTGGGSNQTSGGSGGKGGGSSTTTSDKKLTTKGAGGKRTFAQAYEIAKKKYPKAYGKMTLAQYTAEAKKQIANRKETGKYIGGEKKQTEAEKKEAEKKEADNQAKTDVEMKQSDVDRKNAEDKKKFEEAKAKAAAAAEKKKKEKAAADLKAAEEYNKKNLKPRSRSRKKVKVDVVKDTKTGARLKTKTRTRKDGTVKTKVKETRIIGGVASKTRKVKDTRKEQKKKDKKKNGKNGNSTSQLGSAGFRTL